MTFYSSLQTMLLPLFPFIIFIIFIHNKWTSTSSKTKNNTPPSPWRLPVIGNLHQLGSTPYRALQTLSQKHGPIMLLHLGSLPTLVVSSSDAAQEIMQTHDLSFASRPNLTIPNILFHNMDIAFAPFGEYWRQLKTITSVHLLSKMKVKLYRKVREDEIVFMLNVLGGSAGTALDIGPLLRSYVNNVICRVAIGRAYDDGLKRTNILGKFVDVFAAFNVASYIPWLSWIDGVAGSVRRAKRVAEEFDELLEGVIEEHVNKRKEDGAKDDVQDFVDILLDVQKQNTTGFTVSRDCVKAVLLDVFAGTESTFASLEWAMSELVRNPRIMKKLQQELTEVAQGRSMIFEDDLKNMRYLKAIIKESFRLHIPVPLLVPRKSLQDVKLMGYDIPSGTQVLVNAWAIGRDPTVWDEPTEFRPERFLNSPVDYHGSHFELIPYGAGQRICSGMQFSVAIIELALANIAYKFDLAVPNGMKNEDVDMSEAYGVTVHRKSPLLVSTSPRF